MTQRKLQVYCLGNFRSGTKTIHTIFDRYYLSKHQPEENEVISFIFDILNNRTPNRNKQVEFIKKRDDRLTLDVESSIYLFFIRDLVVEAFPEAKHILLVRDCYSWLDSVLNFQFYGMESGRLTSQLNKLFNYFGNIGGLNYHHSEKILEESKLFPLKKYLSFWKMHYIEMKKIIQKDNLFVLKTSEFAREKKYLATFLKVPENTIEEPKVENISPKRYHFLRMIEKEYLQDVMLEICGELMFQLFPDKATVEYASNL